MGHFQVGKNGPSGTFIEMKGYMCARAGNSGGNKCGGTNVVMEHYH